MAIPSTKTEFGDWCKRKLGYPVIDINVDADQVDDRVDEAIQYYQMFMAGGERRMYLNSAFVTEPSANLLALIPVLK